MWLGDYTLLNLLGLLIQSIFIQNILLFYFLGMCSYLACSGKFATANGLGLAVFVVITISGTLNWFITHFITGDNALFWLKYLRIDPTGINLNFLELIIFIAVIASLVQILEILIDRFSPKLYASLGVYLPLITVNCAILGASLFATVRDYPLIPNITYSIGVGLGWWLAIILIATLKQRLRTSEVIPGMEGMGITFMTTGLIALAFMAFTGINLDKPTKPTKKQSLPKTTLPPSRQ